jgi:hypothetical protein
MRRRGKKRQLRDAEAKDLADEAGIVRQGPGEPAGHEGIDLAEATQGRRHQLADEAAVPLGQARPPRMALDRLIKGMTASKDGLEAVERDKTSR